MNTFGFLDVVGSAAVALLLAGLGWAAAERGRIHRRRAVRSSVHAAAHRNSGPARLLARLRHLGGARRIHLAVSAVAASGVA